MAERPPVGFSELRLARMEADGWTPQQVRDLIAEHRRLLNFHALELDAEDAWTDPSKHEEELARACAEYLVIFAGLTHVRNAVEHIGKMLGRYRTELAQRRAPSPEPECSECGFKNISGTPYGCDCEKPKGGGGNGA
jgi:hypothetical protein